MHITDPYDADLPPGHVPTLRVATPDPRDAKRHLRIRSGWAHYHMAACLVDLPKKYSETSSAPVDEIECPRCRKSPEFARAMEEARNPEPVSGAAKKSKRIQAQPAATTTRPKTETQPRKKAGRNQPHDPPSSGAQGSLF